jgi:hypothetical protein
MKLKYYPDTDSLYIDLSEQPSVESQEVSEGLDCRHPFISRTLRRLTPTSSKPTDETTEP